MNAYQMSLSHVLINLNYTMDDRVMVFPMKCYTLVVNELALTPPSLKRVHFEGFECFHKAVRFSLSTVKLDKFTPAGH